MARKKTVTEMKEMMPPKGKKKGGKKKPGLPGKKPKKGGFPGMLGGGAY